MTPDSAVIRIREAVASMSRLYGRTLFDEWALIAISGTRGCVVNYDGPRRAEFVRLLTSDLQPLRAELDRLPHHPGMFGFCREAHGSNHDAFVVAGAGVYLLFNNTSLSIRDIAEDARWRKAQAPFVELADGFRLDPVEHPSAVSGPRAVVEA